MQLSPIVDRPTIDSLMRSGIAALRAGNQVLARELLTQATTADPRSEQAWLWLSGAVSSDSERLRCLQQVLAINPQSEPAHRGLALILHAEMLEPPVITPPEHTPAVPDTPRSADVPLETRNGELSADARVAIDYALDQLSGYVGHDAATRAVADHLGCSWSQAERVVEYVETERRTSLARRQAPFLLFLGAGTLLVGSFYAIRSGVALSYEMHVGRMLDGGAIQSLCIGLVMIAGSTIGMWQVVRAMW